ncbi:hypothetical protein Q7C36_021125 [Tachysurus vachellii]|uniref:Metalloendopeptidase n=1 Tax=Tachysurus vachellii TaxID=175792 RepID=A0AA88ITA8_TACVA|nr:hypothetical protein Q7C36_021125 [Tachysurus vachellii]
MESRASLSILALLIGFTQALYLNQPEHVDITSRILTINSGSSKELLEGDILLPRTRNALVCRDNSCFWKKSSNGLVQVCFSDVGRSGGAQVLSLSRSGCVYYGIAEHELNHALGFYHEHSRSDRDSYVTINWENIDPSSLSSFKLRNTNNLNTSYDYSSVMHYGRTAFSINDLDTITPIPDPSVEIGQRTELSAIDILRINKLYKC